MIIAKIFYGGNKQRERAGGTAMNPIVGNGSPQSAPRTMQDVVPSPRKSGPQPAAASVDGPVQPEIVSNLPVKVQEEPVAQAHGGSDNPIASNRPPGPVAEGRDDKELDKALKDINKQIKKDDNKPPKVSVFKRWESAIVVVIALGIASALCLAAVSAFK